MGSFHAEPLCLFIHHLHKSISGTAYGIRQCDTALRTGGQHGTIKKINGTDCFTWLKTCLCGILLIKSREHFLCQCNLLIQIIQVLNRHNYRHNLRHRSRIDLLIALHISDDLPAFYLHQYCIGTVDSTHFQFTDYRPLQRLHPVSHSLVPTDNYYKCQDHNGLHNQTECHFYSVYFFFYFFRFTLFCSQFILPVQINSSANFPFGKHICAVFPIFFILT